MSPRSRTLQALTDPGSAYRSPPTHRRRRVAKKKAARWYREGYLASKWLRGMHDRWKAYVKAAELWELFGAPGGASGEE